MWGQSHDVVVPRRRRAPGDRVGAGGHRGRGRERGGVDKSEEVEDAFAFSPPGQRCVHVRRAVGPGAHAREWGGRRARGFPPRGRARSSRRGSRRVRAARRGWVDD